jgi:ElaB/YqjD/DUF883 family membrane-anchored ribosome-binding protein
MPHSKTGSAAEADTIEALRAEVERLTSALEAERARHGSAFSRETAEELGERMQEGFGELQKQIDANPVPSALIAFGIGFLIGRLFTR